MNRLTILEYYTNLFLSSNKFEKMDEERITNVFLGNLTMESALIVIQNLHIQSCRKFHELSESIITFLNTLIYTGNLFKIQSLTISDQGDIYFLLSYSPLVLKFCWKFFFCSYKMKEHILIVSWINKKLMEINCSYVVHKHRDLSWRYVW